MVSILVSILSHGAVVPTVVDTGTVPGGQYTPPAVVAAVGAGSLATPGSMQEVAVVTPATKYANALTPASNLRQSLGVASQQHYMLPPPRWRKLVGPPMDL